MGKFKKTSKSILKRTGRGLTKAGKIVGPALVKQGRLIRQQQLRDDALALKLRKLKLKEKKYRMKHRKSKRESGLFAQLDF